ncbi:hypothetical protein [Kribbella sp. NPDC050469]
MSWCVCIGLLVVDNLGLTLTFGVAIGAGLGAAVESATKCR